jgi:hypothetical protein
MQLRPRPSHRVKVAELEGQSAWSSSLRPGDLTQKNKWPEYLQWIVDNTMKFRNTFGPRVRGLVRGEDPAAEATTS